MENWRQSLEELDRLINYHFRYDSDWETCMEMIEKIRRKTLYEHPPVDCVEECKKRGKTNNCDANCQNSDRIITFCITVGCGQLSVTDGIWKTVFPHCMFRVKVSSSRANILQ